MNLRNMLRQAVAALLVLLLAACDPSTPPGFSLGLEPSSLSLGQGQSGEVAVTLQHEGDFDDEVALSLEGLPEGVSGVFTPNPADGSCILTLDVEPSVTGGSYTITIRGTSGSLSDTITLELLVTEQGFTLSLTPPAIEVGQGLSGEVTVVIERTPLFTADVVLTLEDAPQGISGVFTPNPASGDASIMELTLCSNVRPGTHTLTVRGTGASRTATATLSLNVTEQGFSLSLRPTLVTVPQGLSGSVLIELERTESFTEPVTLDLDGAPTGITASFAPNPVSGSSSLLTLDTAADLAPDIYTLAVTGTSATRSSNAPLTLVVPERGFSLAADPTELVAEQSLQGTVAIAITRTPAFTDPVALELAGAPDDVTATFAPNPASGDESTLTLAVGAGVPAGSYDLAITGSADALVNSVPLALTVTARGFTLTATPDALTLEQGLSADLTVAIGRTPSFTEAVDLALESAPEGVTGSFTPDPTDGPSSVLTLEVAPAVPIGTYALQISGAAGEAYAATTELDLTVTSPPQDLFRLTLTPDALSIEQGEDGTVSVAIDRAASFTEPVTLTAALKPDAQDITVVFSPNPAADVSTLTLRIGRNVPARTYLVEVAGASGTFRDTAPLDLIVVQND